jgi:lipid-binding SYLF domain-containing protein
MTMLARTISAILIAALILLGSIDSGNAAGGSVRETLDRLYRHVPGSHDLVARSAGILVFPTVVKAGPVVGFILDPQGLMYNLTLEGSKITRMR